MCGGIKVVLMTVKGFPIKADRIIRIIDIYIYELVGLLLASFA